jgi:glycosyltransferase involved in cell wall biosynthesis
VATAEHLANTATPIADGPGDVWVVIAAYNEEAHLSETLRAVCASWPCVVLVDDGSTDATSAVAVRYPVWVLRHVINCGQGAALQTGIDFALSRGAAIVVTFDADGQHQADEMERLVAPVRAGQVEVALGSRFLGKVEGMPWGRWLVLKLGVLYTRIFSRIRVTDTHNGFRALSRRAAQVIRITHNGMAHASEILDQVRRHGLGYCEVPVTVRYTASTMAKGQNSWNGLWIIGQLLLGKMIR